MPAPRHPLCSSTSSCSSDVGMDGKKPPSSQVYRYKGALKRWKVWTLEFWGCRSVGNKTFGVFGTARGQTWLALQDVTDLTLPSERVSRRNQRVETAVND